MNNDLISREALKKALKSNCDLCHDKNTNWCEHCCPLNDFEDLIDNATTVEPTFGMFRAMLCETCQAYATNRAIVKLADDFTRPQGEWIIDFDRFSCPFCKMTIDDEVHYLYSKEYGFNYCPNCGAKLRIGGVENE